MFYVIIGIVFLSLLLFEDSFLSFEGLFNLYGVQLHRIFLREVAILSRITLVRKISLIISGFNTSFFYKSEENLVVQFNGDIDKVF